jgi:hypothetical protein
LLVINQLLGREANGIAAFTASRELLTLGQNDFVRPAMARVEHTVNSGERSDLSRPVLTMAFAWRHSENH